MLPPPADARSLTYRSGGNEEAPRMSSGMRGALAKEELRERSRIRQGQLEDSDQEQFPQFGVARLRTITPTPCSAIPG
jgi:hypothetical protein